MVLTWPQHQKKIHKKNMYKLGRPICNPWSQCCYDKILLFWWNAYCRITTTLKSNFICLFFSFLIFLSFCWVSMFVYEWWKGFYFFSLGYGHINTRVTKIVCLCSFTLVWLLGFNLKKKKNNDTKIENIWEVETLVPTFWCLYKPVTKTYKDLVKKCVGCSIFWVRVQRKVAPHFWVHS